MMNILFVTVAKVDKYKGGIERVCYNLKNLLDQHDSFFLSIEANSDDTSFCLPNNHDLLSKENNEYVNRLIVDFEIDIVINNSHVRKLSELLFNVKRHIGFKVITVVHTDLLYPVKTLRDDHEIMPFHHKGCLLFFKQVRSFLKFPISKVLRKRGVVKNVKFLHLYSDAVVVLSNGAKVLFENFAKGKNLEKIHFIPNPLLSVMGKDDTSLLKQRKNQVLFVGRLVHQKRVDRLLRMWKTVEKESKVYQLLILGDGDARNDLEKYSEDLGLENVSFLGTQNPDKYYEESKVLAMTSSHEGFGMVLIEAQQKGCVPIAFDSYPALADIIDDGKNGILIKTYELNAYSSSLIGLMDDEVLLKKMSLMAMQRVDGFEPNVIVQKWERLFVSLMKSRL